MLSYENVRTAFSGYLINQQVTQVAWTGKIASVWTNLSRGCCVKPSDTAGHIGGGVGGGRGVEEWVDPFGVVGKGTYTGQRDFWQLWTELSC